MCWGRSPCSPASPWRCGTPSWCGPASAAGSPSCGAWCWCSRPLSWPGWRSRTTSSGWGRTTDRAAVTRPSWFQRFLLPGFAFKAVVIGGGYATGRELAEYFLVSGPAGGALGMLVTMLCWSALCAGTFLFAHVTGSHDFGAFFRALLGRAAVLFDLVYACFLLIVLSVFGAAAGELGRSVLQWPTWAGTVLLVLSIAAVVTYGNRSVEALFRYVTYFLYAVYVALFVLCFFKVGDRI